MATLPLSRIAALLSPFCSNLDEPLLRTLSTYLDVLVRWNARTNLTAIRDPEQIVLRHFGESLFAARFIPSSATTLLDLGTGAGFPGVPMQLAHSRLKVMLAESQNKKVAFLRELLRTLDIAPEIWPARVEVMPEQRTFSLVTLRAVDDPAQALELALPRLASGGSLLLLGTAASLPHPEWPWTKHLVPGSTSRCLFVASEIVPRGTIVERLR